MSSDQPGSLRRELGTFDAVMVGLGSMIGAGIFAALAPAAQSAGSALLIGLCVAAVIAYCNATSSARLAAVYPASGGTYVYGRKRLGDFWGYLAGWGFVVGKTASCAAMALTVGFYAWPAHAHAVAVAAVVALTAINYAGVQKSAWLTRVIVAIVLSVLAALVVTVFGSGRIDAAALDVTDASLTGVLQAAGLLFFAFAGYARIATLGEEVREPARTIPRAIPIALGITLVVYAVVAVAVLTSLGPSRLAASAAPLLDTVAAVGARWMEPVVRIGAVVAATGSLLALILGVSRTTFAMARDRHLPHALAAVHPRNGVPYRAELLVGLVVSVLTATVDLRGAIGFSSFAVLVYYAVANAAAWTLSPAEGRPPRIVPVLGLIGCVVIALALPPSSVLSGVAVLAVGIAVYALRRISDPGMRE
ncbi:APC family permease [Mycobacteroides franklinii]|uniref:Amino acid permease n=1 Tax=Mycobacteroides franklinii TaxID=948102 RepID=A0A4R5PFG1_9MYCO|nr:amino acid permease [Mycobacteroides franklinii]ORA58258.1 transporter [Mycobacteroides franklinii]TDH24853.1 amino acid permease [Mycobacteroides franklinii]TDZ42831.1 putative amino acid permease YhdG [Mycobacteroides franklinii]TDZ52980.1 putative amino acid permease YhdG [Mycobacteroides franklinii]TDZ56386.1 putative amino acid permease YhdG [Mycobacteroides franklinii]